MVELKYLVRVLTWRLVEACCLQDDLSMLSRGSRETEVLF